MEIAYHCATVRMYAHCSPNLICMNEQRPNSKNTIQQTPAKEVEESVIINLSIPKSLYNRLVAFKNLHCYSTDQEVTRVGLNNFLRRNGF